VGDRGHGRGTRAGTRRLGRTHAALPDPDAHPIRRVDLRKLDVRAVREDRMALQRGSHSREALFVGQGSEQDALRVADGEDGRPHLLAAGVDRGGPQVRGETHAGPEGEPGARAVDERQRARTSVGRDHDLRSRHDLRRVAAVPDDDRRQRAHPVARELGRAAVGIEQPHRRALGREVVQDQPVAAGAPVAVAQAPGRGGQVARAEIAAAHEEEVVPVRVGLGQLHMSAKSLAPAARRRGETRPLGTRAGSDGAKRRRPRHATIVEHMSRIARRRV
jgi:hypothetical protein